MDIDAVVGLKGETGSLISLYVRQGPALSARISDLLKPIRARAENGHRDLNLSIREDVKRISELSDRMGRDGAAGYAVFASHHDQIFEVVPLSGLGSDSATLGVFPDVRPLRLMRPPLHGVAVVWERSHAEIFEWIDGELSPQQHLESDIGKSNFGGFKGFEEHRVRRHGEEEVARMLSSVGAWLLELHQRANLDFVLAGGHQSELDALTPHLHDYLSRLPRINIVVDPHTLSLPQLADHMRAAETEVHRVHESDLANAVLDSEHGAIPAALGVASVLAAVNVKAVEHLVVCGDFSKPGVECLRCGWLGRGGPCPVCSVDTIEIDDILGRAIEAVIEARGEVSGVGVATRLDTHGCGALLRFPV